MDDLFSIVFDKRQADKVLTPLGIENLVLGLLARQPPEPQWNGCLIFSGETPLDPTCTRCVAMCGPHADAVQQRLVETLESLDIPVLGVYEGGPEVQLAITRVRDGKWGEP